MNIFTKLSNICRSFGGLLDTAASSLGTLLVGIAAVRILTTAELATYSVVFTAVFLLALIPQQICLAPRRMRINLENFQRSSFRADIAASKLALVVAIALLPLAALPAKHLVHESIYWNYCLSGTALIIASTFNLHTRSLLHVIGRHTLAAISSVISLLTTVALLLATFMWSNEFPVALMNPLTCLAGGHTMGLLVWFRLRKTNGKVLVKYDGEKLRQRIMYLGPQLIVQGVTYILITAVAWLLGAKAVAALEVARIATAPIVVLVTGLAAVMVPAAIRTYSSRGIKHFSKSHSTIQLIILCVGAIYCLILVTAEPVISDFLDQEIVLGLALARAVGFTLTSVSSTLSWVTMTLRRAGAGLRISVLSAFIPLALVVPVALWVGPFSVPIAESAAAFCRIIGTKRLIQKSD